MYLFVLWWHCNLIHAQQLLASSWFSTPLQIGCFISRWSCPKQYTACTVILASKPTPVPCFKWILAPMLWVKGRPAQKHGLALAIQWQRTSIPLLQFENGFGCWLFKPVLGYTCHLHAGHHCHCTHNWEESSSNRRCLKTSLTTPSCWAGIGLQWSPFCVPAPDASIHTFKRECSLFLF